MNDLSALAAATEEFRSRLVLVGDDAWALPTPCGEWDVAALVRHVNFGNRMAELLAHGADAKTSVGPDADPPDGVSALETFDVTATAQSDSLAEPGVLERTIDHPAMEMPGELLLMFRTADLALHAWDLATALGVDSTIDEAVCASLWLRLEPIAALLPASGMFGTPKGELSPAATSFEKVLHATGR